MQVKISKRDFFRSALATAGFSAGWLAMKGNELDDSPITNRLTIGGGEIEVDLDPKAFDLPTKSLLQWVTNAALAVVAYYGTFPVKRMRIRIRSSDEQTGVFRGTTWGRTPPFTRIFVGQRTTQDQLEADWMMTHEMIHTAFPDLLEEHHWMEEGIATYVEPVARAQAGQLKEEKIWADMLQGMPKGEPRAGDAGLDHTHTWGRTYWGGALFCLAADVQIRRASQNKVGLQQALRAIQRAGGTIETHWSIEKAFTVGDTATHAGVLNKLYGEMKDKPVTIDLKSLWTNLGVQIENGHLSFDDRAPWAATRLSITAPAKPEAF